MGYERLTPSDATFIHLENQNTHMHVASLCIFDGASPYEDAMDMIASRLHLVPRFRQKLALVPYGQGRPVWVDDTHFNLEYHVRHTALPAPGSDDQLRRLIGRVMSQQLDRTKPLWELWVVDGLEGGRSATITKAHHCMVDGVSGADLLSVLLDLEAAPPRTDAAPWTPAPEPSSSELLRDAVLERILEPAEIARGARAALRAPRRFLDSAVEFLGGVGALAWAGLNPAPATPINAPVGPHRRFDYLSTNLKDFKTIKNALGGTVNDVVLAVVSGALRRFLEYRNFDVRGLEMKAMVPVSIRADNERGALGNRITQLIAPLPLYEPDPVTRLQIVEGAMKDVKESRQAVGAERIVELSGFAPPTILAQASRLQGRQRFFNILVTNVPGPQFPLYSLGHRLLELYPIAPLGENQQLGVAVMSTDGRMGFGLIADFDAVPDLEVMTEGLRRSIDELLDASGTSNGARARQRISIARTPSA